jgi:hypothetical protein
MPEFDALFRQAEDELERIRSGNPEIQNALNRYDGRSLVLNVDDDGVYVFQISSHGIDYELNPQTIPNDMYARMDIGTARKLVYTQNLGFFDLLRIEHRNIGMEDIGFIKQLFSK